MYVQNKKESLQLTRKEQQFPETQTSLKVNINKVLNV